MISNIQNSSAITKSSGSNFVSSFWFLPKEKREALTSIYAFCRLTDDIVDLASNPELAKENLDAWSVQLQQAFEETSSHPVLKDIAQISQRYHIPREYFFQLIDGMEMDLTKKTYQTFEELYSYCYFAASVVGLICLEVFGCQDQRSKEFAVNLGIAFQLTNILRDLRTDLQRGRIYLPQEDLKKYGLSSEDFLTLKESVQVPPGKITRFQDLIQFECARAESYYKNAFQNLVPADRANLIAAEVMCAVYHAILEKIKRNPLLPLKSKIRLNKLETGYRILQGWAKNRLGL